MNLKILIEIVDICGIFLNFWIGEKLETKKVM